MLRILKAARKTNSKVVFSGGAIKEFADLAQRYNNSQPQGSPAVSHPVLASFARSLGAVHVALGVTLVAPREKVPLAAAVLAGCFVFWLGRSYRDLGWRELLMRAYVGPVALVSLAYLWEADPPTWEAGLDSLSTFAAGVASGTPAFLYLVLLAFSCLGAAERGGRPS